jgi:hypothetical protein
MAAPLPGLLTAAETAALQATVGAALDKSLPLLRKVPSLDTYGHNTETLVSNGNIVCNVFHPTATHLQLYADIIGAQQAMMLRFLPGTDVIEGDEVTYKGQNWTVQVIQVEQSYTIPNDLLMTVVH